MPISGFTAGRIPSNCGNVYLQMDKDRASVYTRTAAPAANCRTVARPTHPKDAKRRSGDLRTQVDRRALDPLRQRSRRVSPRDFGCWTWLGLWRSRGRSRWGDRWQSDPEATYRIPDLARLGYDVPACLLYRPHRPLDSGAE